MSQNIEIEFKNMLSEDEFNKIVNHFHLTATDFFKQENHYFDTKDFALKQHRCALRIREKKDHFEMTLKEPHQDGLLETNENLDDEYARQLLNGSHIKDGIIKGQISALNINTDDLLYFGSLVTERTEFTYQGGLLVLDCSSYLNIKDYEVEYEVSNRDNGKSIFLHLLAELNIPIRKTENKVKRFYDRKKIIGLQ
ncbi:CYTH domain-containing protein [Bacillus sp. V3B]|uniref:CYTH domain-containing protein n=1 Tax=Bacillus sp. V3B TaxID=2804915 RepID=UPI00210A43EA|nr:CYTH domain-containing protein [Bacillus sp. V3B]MCQ6274298.1 CYTH domain-containing protein [Bacillus sp. V3B]